MRLLCIARTFDFKDTLIPLLQQHERKLSGEYFPLYPPEYDTTARRFVVPGFVGTPKHQH